MKLAFSTLACPDWSFAEAVAAAAKFGYDAIEVRGIREELRAERLAPFFPENAAVTKALLARAGIRLVCLGTSVNFDRESDAAAMQAEGVQAIAVCERMEIPYLRVFGNRIDPQESEAEAIARVADGLCRLIAHCRTTRVLLEVHGSYTRAAQFQQIIARVPSPQWGLLWDVAHTDADYGANFRAFYEPLRERILHIHIKDHRRTATGTRLTDVGKGDIPLADICRMLRADGYDGCLSYEGENRWDRSLTPPETAIAAYADFMRGIDG